MPNEIETPKPRAAIASQRCPLSTALTQPPLLQKPQTQNCFPLNFKTSNITDSKDDMKDPIDIAPFILFNFALDTVSFPHLPQTQKDKPTSARDLCLKIELAQKLDPDFRCVLNYRERILRWPDYMFDGAEAVSMGMD
ncbi:hypothetical protein BGZ60DRAFT_410913 [Tricladium varicosporioides]|nr:hypothetical protein BGZ60DRAFT_410913 [Hymenoscyphus varicosporioides]